MKNIRKTRNHQNFVRNIRKDIATEATVLIRGIPLDVVEVSEKHIHECSFHLVELLA